MRDPRAKASGNPINPRFSDSGIPTPRQRETVVVEKLVHLSKIRSQRVAVLSRLLQVCCGRVVRYGLQRVPFDDGSSRLRLGFFSTVLSRVERQPC